MSDLVGRCRDCGAKVVWVQTINGKRMPLDPEPAPGGNVTVTQDDHGNYVANVARKETAVLNGYWPHFATCPARQKRDA